MDKSFTNNNRKLDQLENKTQDLEDRSRRDNLVFFGIEETDGTEDSETLLIGILKEYKFLDPTFDPETQAYFERVHRLGPRKKDETRPRPIIAKMSFFKDKEALLKGVSKLKKLTIQYSRGLFKGNSFSS